MPAIRVRAEGADLVPDALLEVVYDFWDAAQTDISSDWMREIDPANHHPKVRALNLRVAEFIRATPSSFFRTKNGSAQSIPWIHRAPAAKSSCFVTGLRTKTSMTLQYRSFSRRSSPPACSRWRLRGHSLRFHGGHPAPMVARY